jgi:hypothetical protein
MVTRRRGAGISPGGVLLLVSVLLFLLTAFGVSLGEVNIGALGLAAFAGSFIFR